MFQSRRKSSTPLAKAVLMRTPKLPRRSSLLSTPGTPMEEARARYVMLVEFVKVLLNDSFFGGSVANL